MQKDLGIIHASSKFHFHEPHVVQDRNTIDHSLELEEIQDKDTSPSENTSEIPVEVEGFEPPQEEEAPVCRSILCLNVEVEKHSLGDLYEPTNYKAALLDPESDKWLDAMNAAMQSMKDNQV
ncbi:hypothetical protein Tco_1386583 [Tanacetum coccineum]